MSDKMISFLAQKTNADRFCKSMPAAFKKPTLIELVKPLRDFDYRQVDESWP